MTMPAAIAGALGAHRGSHMYSHAPSIEDYNDDTKLRSFCIAFRPDNKIHLFPPARQTARLLRVTVESYWSIESDEAHSNCYTLNLEGAPFLMYSRRENALKVKYICCLLLEQFKLHGWELVVCTDLSSKTDLTAWYFSRVPVDELGRPLQSSTQQPDGLRSLVCLSLSAKRKLQLINAPEILKAILRELVVTSYEPGFDQDAHYGRDYQIKLKGSPWDTTNRGEVVAACKLIISAFREFGANGFHLYGLVNLKDTADSMFFEYDPMQTFLDDDYMMIALDEGNILRVTNASPQLVRVIKASIDRYWPAGLEAEGRIGALRSPKASPKTAPVPTDDTLAWEFVLKGSPWQTSTAKIGQSRQLVTYLLDALLAYGWTVVTGLDISRVQNKKSALLFQKCPPVRGLHHACLSPLGNKRYQLINAPPSLRHLVRREFADMVINEKLNEDETIHEMMLDRRRSSWWVADPEQEKDSYIYARKRMGRLLDTLMRAKWRVIASADVARQVRDEDNDEEGEGIHSWFIIYCGSFIDATGENPIRVTANSSLHAGGRVDGGATDRPESLLYLGPPRADGHRGSITVAMMDAGRRRSLTEQWRNRSVREHQHRRTDASPTRSPLASPNKVSRPRRSRSNYDIDG